MNRHKILIFIRNNNLVFILMILAVVGYFVSDSFISVNNLVGLLKQISILGILSCGLTFCVIAGNIDLSIGAVVPMAAVISIVLQPVNWIFAVVIAIISGLIVGTLNGLIVGRLKANSIIVTLGMTAIIQSFTLEISGGGEILASDQNSPFSFIGKGEILNIPVPIIIFSILAIFSYLLLSKAVFGQYVFSIGSNEQISWLAGIKTANIRMGTFIIMGMFGSISGVVLASRLAHARAFVGSSLLFDSLTVVILAGTDINGGKGSIPRTIVGVLVIGLVGNIFLLADVAPQWHYLMF